MGQACSCGKGFPSTKLMSIITLVCTIYTCQALFLLPEDRGQRPAWVHGEIPFSMQCGQICVAPCEPVELVLFCEWCWHCSALLPLSITSPLRGNTQGRNTMPTPSDHLLVWFCFSQGKKQGAAQSLCLAGGCSWKPSLWTTKNGVCMSFIKNVLQIQWFVTISERGCCQLPVILLHTEASPGVSPLAKVWDSAEYQIPLLHIIVLAKLSWKLPVYM